MKLLTILASHLTLTLAAVAIAALLAEQPAFAGVVGFAALISGLVWIVRYIDPDFMLWMSLDVIFRTIICLLVSVAD